MKGRAEVTGGKEGRNERDRREVMEEQQKMKGGREGR